MLKILELLPPDRRDLFAISASKIGVDPVIIEKDFWVVFILWKLFSSELSPHLTFKGGTSLSKGYNLIERFSEDIDITISREKILKLLRKASVSFVEETLLPLLKLQVKKDLKRGFDLKIEPEDPQCVQFYYPASFKQDYIPTRVLIECGARGDPHPLEKRAITPYVYDYFPDLFESPIDVLILSPVRTFWEKATLLHAETNRSIDKKLPLRISRHAYDLTKLYEHGYLEKALADIPLLDGVIRKKSIMFPSSWAEYDSIKETGLRLIPPTKWLVELKNDYEKTKIMIFKAPPTFKIIMKTLQVIEEKINKRLGIFKTKP